MDAARLVAEAERAMNGSPEPEHVIAEAWQACELVEAVGRALVPEDAPPAVRPGVVVAAPGAGPPRAARLSGVRDPGGTLRALRVLLGELTHALVTVICAVQDEAAYWQCIEALDAVDEARDRVRVLTDARRPVGEGS